MIVHILLLNRNPLYGGIMKKNLFIIPACILFCAGLFQLHAQPGIQNMTADQAREEEAYILGVQAAIWGHPLCDYVFTNAAGAKAGATYINYWHKFSTLKTAADRYVVTPNNVTIDGYGLGDLGKEPVVIKVPKLEKPRWYIIQVGNMFDEVIRNIGGYKGEEPGLYFVSGPDYTGPVPFNMEHIRVNTNMAVIALRIAVNGDKDLPAAVKEQGGFHLLPYSVFRQQGLNYQIPKMDAARLQFTPEAPENLRYFEQLGFAMKMYLSPNADFSDQYVMQFHRIGLSAANGFEWRNLDDAAKRGLARALPVADRLIDNANLTSAVVVDGWRYTMGAGRAGYDFTLRAALAKTVLGANVAEESLYPNTQVDSTGGRLNGANKYVLRFTKDQIPPVSVFWNLNMFGDDMFFVENAFKRYSIGSTTDGLKTNPDGSIEIYIQHESPGKDKESNWLPAPSGNFNLTMRLYGAEAPILNGSYHLPGVRKVQ